MRNDSAGVEVEVDLFQHDATGSLPPDAHRQIRNDVVPVHDVEEKASARLQGTSDALGHTQIRVFVEIAKRREHRVRAVELLLKGHLAHVGMYEVDGQCASLRFVGGTNQQGQRQV